jgi:hypothetical protein
MPSESYTIAQPILDVNFLRFAFDVHRPELDSARADRALDHAADPGSAKI